MFQVFGVEGRVFSGTLEGLCDRRAVTGVARVRRTVPFVSRTDLLRAMAHHGRHGGVSMTKNS